MDKSDFILQLLVNPRLNADQRLRVLDLAKRDYLGSEGKIEEILQRIQHIEKEVGVKTKPKRNEARWHSREEFLDGEDLIKNIDFDNIQFPDFSGGGNKNIGQFNDNFKPIKKKGLTLMDMSKPESAGDVAEEKAEKVREGKFDSNKDLLFPIIHNPKKTVELLTYFTANDKNLKYSTHSWEEGKFLGYDDFFGKIHVEWNSIKKDLYSQSERLYAKVSNFLFNDKLGQLNEKKYYHAWGENKLKFGWASPEIKTHMETLGKSPFSCEIPVNIKKLDKSFNLHFFSDYANVFKNEIEFREDTKNLKKMILDLWDEYLTYDFQISEEDLKSLEGFSFFTDVHLIKEAWKIIFRDMFKPRPEYNEIKIERISNFKYRYHIIKITQLNSFVTRSVEDIKFTEPTGNLDEIIKLLRNICDYSIISKFSDGKKYRLNYLSSASGIFKDLLDDDYDVNGFTHEFKFYLNEKSNPN
jgi:hypothetical protein